MNGAHKPAGYSSVSPYLVVDDIAPVIAFLEDGLGASEGRRYESSAGALVHGEYLIDDSVVMIAESTEEYPAITSIIHVYVADVDSVYEQALAAGGQAVDEPSEREGDPDRRGSVKDPAGNTWAIATQVT